MKTTILLVLLITSNVLTGHSQTPYETKMKQALQFWGSQKPMEAIALFERIASAEKENWLPNYYIGLISATQVLSGGSDSLSELLLEKAQRYFELANKISPENPELYCLKGLIYTAQIKLDPMTNGQKLSQPTIEAYQKAIQLDPNNPRPLYLLAEFQIHMAKYMGQDTELYYNMIKKSLAKFDTFTTPEAFYPTWGQDRAKQILAARHD